MKTKKLKKNLEKQEELVGILYKLIKDLQENKHDCQFGENKNSFHYKSLESTVDNIMELFGYEIISIQ